MTSAHSVIIVIETPKGSKHRYKFNQQNDSFSLQEQLSKGLNFPYDFGYIEHTSDGNESLLRAVVIGDGGTFPGCRLACRIIGGIRIHAFDKVSLGFPENCYFAVPVCEGAKSITTLNKLCPGTLENIKSFLVNYSASKATKIKFLKDMSTAQAVKEVKQAQVGADVSIKLELLLPYANRNGNKFPKQLFDEVNQELIARFGGLTVHTRQPAEGFWKPDNRTVQQPILVYELMLTTLDLSYWKRMKNKLEKQFSQTEIMIVYGPANKVH